MLVVSVALVALLILLKDEITIGLKTELLKKTMKLAFISQVKLS
jgi:hypothetical protein